MSSSWTAERRRQPREARKVVAAFQTKSSKYLESTLGSPDRAEETRAKLAVYTASHAVYEDLTRMLCVLRAREALAKFTDALPASIERFDDARVSKIAALLDGFAKDHARPFHLRWRWWRGDSRPMQLVRLATKAARARTRRCGRGALCDRGLDGAGPAGRQPLGVAGCAQEREGPRRQGNPDQYLRYRIRIAGSHRSARPVRLGKRLSRLMDAIAALVDDELARFPTNSAMFWDRAGCAATNRWPGA